MALARYALVGGVATVAHYAVLTALVELRWLPAGWAATLGACIGAVVAYIGNRRLTFPTSGVKALHSAPRFFLVALVGALINGLLVWAGTQGLGAHYLVAQGAATAMVLFLTYHLNRMWTFA